ncbi:MAG TPA: 3-deoxy-manno-octulosonate-8-phosphatase KdsC [Burkholderiales bacterium]|nr:3-deoxy-manno-octulosonate-8-phosphatase KdsC [Burkholderiales bacterium]
MQDVYQRAKRIRLAIFDVDGVLTDGSLYYTGSGEELKAFNVRDGHGMKMLQASGVRLGIITSRNSRCVELRAKNLGIDLLYQGVADKLAAFQEVLSRLKLDAAASAYMGDDIIDLPVMLRCGLALTVAEAPAAVKSHAHYVSRTHGGRGAVREACELILQAQGTLEAQIAPYLR